MLSICLSWYFTSDSRAVEGRRRGRAALLGLLSICEQKVEAWFCFLLLDFICILFLPMYLAALIPAVPRSVDLLRDRFKIQEMSQVLLWERQR